MKNYLFDFGIAVRDLIFPPRCMACGALSPADVCEVCKNTLHLISSPICSVCGGELPPGVSFQRPCGKCRENQHHFTNCRSALRYEGAAESIIKKFKFTGRAFYSDYLATAMINYWKTNSEMFPDPKTLNFIVPVPLHPRRRRERGFNQSELLATAIGGAFRLPLRKILKRQRSDPPQSTLGIKERQKNIRGAFSVTGLKSLDGMNILLIDDIFTTGATASECARTLKEHGADGVYVYTLARRDFQ